MIQRVSRDFVPVAINLYRVRRAEDGSREFFQSIQSQKDQYQGIWIVTPDGTVLAGRHDYDDFDNGARELLATIDAGLASFGSVEPRPAPPATAVSNDTLRMFLPLRGCAVREDGGIDVALYARQVLGGGRESMPADVERDRAWLWDGPYRADGPAVIDTVSLAPDEWCTLQPARIELGERWSVPRGVARAFTRLLSASSDQSAMPRPEDATVAELECAIESITNGEARIRLSGRWEMVHAIEGDQTRMQFGAATARGVAVYDVESRMLLSFVLVFDGTIRYGHADASPNRIGAVAEWSAR